MERYPYPCSAAEQYPDFLPMRKPLATF